MMAGMSVTAVFRDLAMTEAGELERVEAAMNEEEFRLFYERTSRPLWSYLSRIAGDAQKADDYLQEAYYRFYRAGARHESEAHRRNSLFQIATNLVRDAARRDKRYSEVALQEEEDAVGTVPVSHAPTPDRDAAVRTDLERAMKQIEASQREILWLAYAQGASHEEIAVILGLKAISVRTLLFRARKKLAAILGGPGPAATVQEMNS